MDRRINAIEVEKLRKCYRVRETGAGFRGALKGLFNPAYREVEAVKEISFEIPEGQRVAFIGPNGAGKSTTLKMLTGILHPTAGRAAVLGLVPWEERRRLSCRVGAVFGQRSQLWYQLPAADTFDLLARVYDLDDEVYRRRRGELSEVFRIGGLLSKPVRQLSLGERMRCEIAASLLHAPRILFLDEPTIGLDVTAKAVIRRLIRQISEQSGSTVLLTSHDTGDIEGVCDRVMVINQGSLVLEAELAALRRDYIRQKRVTVQSQRESLELRLPGVREIKSEPYKSVLEIDLAQTGIDAVVEELLRCGGVSDLTVEDPPLEEIIKRIYAGA